MFDFKNLSVYSWNLTYEINIFLEAVFIDECFAGLLICRKCAG